jgi:hypothetical protein
MNIDDDKETSEYTAQIMNYLVPTELKLGFLANFCAFPKAEIIRIVCYPVCVVCVVGGCFLI